MIRVAVAQKAELGIALLCAHPPRRVSGHREEGARLTLLSRIFCSKAGPLRATKDAVLSMIVRISYCHAHTRQASSHIHRALFITLLFLFDIRSLSSSGRCHYQTIINIINDIIIIINDIVIIINDIVITIIMFIIIIITIIMFIIIIIIIIMFIIIVDVISITIITIIIILVARSLRTHRRRHNHADRIDPHPSKPQPTHTHIHTVTPSHTYPPLHHRVARHAAARRTAWCERWTTTRSRTERNRSPVSN
jgi:ABC-type multidrug transport system fused ATPase/permease subunit